MEGRLLFPQIQANKTISRTTAALYTDEVHNGFQFPEKNITSADLEIYYGQTGKKIQGPCELRQAWKYNDITPRTYFAQGGSAYHASKYIRDVINTLTNSFPEVNFQSRFSMHELPMDDADIAFVYDYSSFTSRLCELKHFIEELATFCDSTMVFLVDSHRGIVETSLGSLLREYNQTCNIKGQYTVQRYLEHETTPLQHETAGFLGVYGNIASSTTLHGLHACQLEGDLSKCRCVGDDVFGIAHHSREYSKDDITRSIESLGVIQRSKIRWWTHMTPEEEDEENDRAYPYLKRPLDRFGNRMILEQALFLPIFGLIHPIQDALYRECEDLYTRAKLLAVQTLSCIKQAQALYPPLELHQKDLLKVYLQSLYEYIGFHLRGVLPLETITIQKTKLRNLFVPNVEDGFLEFDPWDLLKHRYPENEVHSVTEMELDPDDMTLEILKHPGREYRTRMSKALQYCQSMSWLKVEKRRIDILWSFEEYKSYIDNLFAGNLVAVYDVTLIVPESTVISDLASFYELECLT